jgi:hypothetical protein
MENEDKDYKKALKKLEEVKKIKTKCLVRARRAEFWIEEHRQELNNVTRNYQSAKTRLEELFKIKRLPWWIHVLAHIKMFFIRPVGYFLERPFHKKILIESYWTFKRIKKEWEDDFDMTEEAIDRDYDTYKEGNKTVKKMESLLNKWKINIIKRKKLNND